MSRRHDVYWGSHGCYRTYGHANPCRCDCGDVYVGTHVYGDDAATAVAMPEPEWHKGCGCPNWHSNSGRDDAV